VAGGFGHAPAFYKQRHRNPTSKDLVAPPYEEVAPERELKRTELASCQKVTGLVEKDMGKTLGCLPSRPIVTSAECTCESPGVHTGQGPITFRWEYNHRASNVRYCSGTGGITPNGGDGNSGPAGSRVPGFTPDLAKHENRMNMAIMVKF
jgi:hypothetical protein